MVQLSHYQTKAHTKKNIEKKTGNSAIKVQEYKKRVLITYPTNYLRVVHWTNPHDLFGKILVQLSHHQTNAYNELNFKNYSILN